MKAFLFDPLLSLFSSSSLPPFLVHLLFRLLVFHSILTLGIFLKQEEEEKFTLCLPLHWVTHFLLFFFFFLILIIIIFFRLTFFLSKPLTFSLVFSLYFLVHFIVHLFILISLLNLTYFILFLLSSFSLSPLLLLVIRENDHSHLPLVFPLTALRELIRMGKKV